MEQHLELNLHRIMQEPLRKKDIMKILLRTILEILEEWIVLLRLLTIIGMHIRMLITTMYSLMILCKTMMMLKTLVL
uniref:Uncharacterized protein n=1 Tax=virus sp. ctBM815 TaxID=2825806 RepID=A0A8S5RJZ0_9VIRU|nr:MAG TPA: hypothetical protein [virus sp. ctBM815]